MKPPQRHRVAPQPFVGVLKFKSTSKRLNCLINSWSFYELEALICAVRRNSVASMKHYVAAVGGSKSEDDVKSLLECVRKFNGTQLRGVVRANALSNEEVGHEEVDRDSLSSLDHWIHLLYDVLPEKKLDYSKKLKLALSQVANQQLKCENVDGKEFDDMPNYKTIYRYLAYLSGSQDLPNLRPLDATILLAVYEDLLACGEKVGPAGQTWHDAHDLLQSRYSKLWAELNAAKSESERLVQDELLDVLRAPKISDNKLNGNVTRHYQSLANQLAMRTLNPLAVPKTHVQLSELVVKDGEKDMCDLVSYEGSGCGGGGQKSSEPEQLCQTNSNLWMVARRGRPLSLPLPKTVNGSAFECESSALVDSVDLDSEMSASSHVTEVFQCSVPQSMEWHRRSSVVINPGTMKHVLPPAEKSLDIEGEDSLLTPYALTEVTDEVTPEGFAIVKVTPNFPNKYMLNRHDQLMEIKAANSRSHRCRSTCGRPRARRNPLPLRRLAAFAVKYSAKLDLDCCGTVNFNMK